MKNTAVLEMINDGDIELLKELLTKEIYEDNLKSGNAKSRYAAMKRYYKYVEMTGRRYCECPCKDVNFYGENYNVFIDGYSMVLTKESIGLMKDFDKTEGDFCDVEKFYNPLNIRSTENIDVNGMLAKAKAMGYKFSKAEFENGHRFVVKYKDSYYKLGLFDKTYNIINDGEETAEVNYIGRYNMLTIYTSIGIAGILPIRYSEDANDNKIIIDLEQWESEG